jgi:aminopeptidase N
MTRLRSHRALLVGLLTASSCARAPVPPAPAAPTSAVVAADAGTVAGPPDGLFRLPAGIRPAAQSVSLAIDPTQPRFSGSTDIQLRVDSQLQEFWVSARELNVRGAFLQAGGERWPVTLEPDDVRGAARVRSPRTLPAGEATLHIDFDAAFNPRLVGVYRVKSTGGWAAYTQFEAIDARRAFPCFDEPSFKIPWTVELRIPAGLQAFGNTPVTEETPADAGTRRVRFATTRPLPSYLVAFSVGDFDVVTPPPLPPSKVRDRPLQVSGIAPKGRGSELGTALGASEGLLPRLEQWFGIPFPYPKLDHLAAPDFAYGGMENAGLIVYTDTALLADPRTASRDERLTVAWVMAHEMAHQWFGDLVTMRFWDDKWLNESFATFMQAEVVVPWNPALDYDLDQLEETLSAMGNDELETARPIRQPIHSENEIAGTDDAVLYPKGSAVLRMFSARLGRERFRGAIREYLTAHADGNATTEDLLAALDRVDPSVGPSFRTFIDQPGVPRVTAELSCEQGQAQLALRQERALPEGSRARRDLLWRLPVCVRLEGRDAPLCTTLETPSQTVPVSGRCPRWVHPNAGATGYYRWLLPQTGLDELVGSGWTALSRAERISAADAVVSAAKDAVLPVDRALALLPRFTRDAEPGVTMSAVALLDHAWKRWASPDDRPLLEARIRALLRPALDRLGFTPRSGESTRQARLRQHLVETLALHAGDRQILSRAAQLGRAWIGTDGRIHPEAVSPDLRDACVAAAARTGDLALFDTVLARLRTTEMGTERSALVRALAEFQQPELQERARALTLTPELRLFEKVALLVIQGRNPGDPDRWRGAWDFTVAHQDELAQMLPESAMRVLPYAQSACTEADAAAISPAFAGRADRVPAVAYDASKAEEIARLCAATRARQAPLLDQALRSAPPGRGPRRAPAPAKPS